MFFFPFLCSAIQDLDLGILKMLIRVCFRHDSQPVCTVYKCTVFTVNLCYLQALAMDKKVLS